MKEKYTLNDYLVYIFCAICFVWSFYVIFFKTVP